MKSETEIRAAWTKWNLTCHPEDRISFVDYLCELDIKLKVNLKPFQSNNGEEEC